MSERVEELSASAVNQLVAVKELYRTYYRAEHMGQDTSELRTLIDAELQMLKNITMIWGYAAEREFLKEAEDDNQS